jgi:hypothetical protein
MLRLVRYVLVVKIGFWKGIKGSELIKKFLRRLLLLFELKKLDLDSRSFAFSLDDEDSSSSIVSRTFP